MSFRLWTIFYVFALFASAMATFGPWGILVAVLILAFWSWVFFGKRPTLVESLVIVFILSVLVAILLPAFESARESSRRVFCENNLKMLDLALLDYESKYGALPPAYTTDAMGKPLQSWRMLLLPAIERGDLYDKIDSALPWNSSANSMASSVDIDAFHCPSDQSPSPTSATTNYFAVTGPHTAWPEGRGRKMSEITDPRSQTILLMETSYKSIPWAQPADLTFDEAVKLLSDPSAVGLHLSPYRSGLFTEVRNSPGLGINVAMSDGSVRFLSLPLPKDLAIALLTIDGGEADLRDQLDSYSSGQLDYAKIYIFCVFVVVSLLPAAWVRRYRAKISSGA